MTDEYSQKEENTFRTDLFRRLDTQDTMLKEIREQTFKTNGRVTVLEEKTKDYNEYKDLVSYLKGWKMYVAGAFAVIIFGGSFVFNLVVKDVIRTSNDNMQILFEKNEEAIALKVVSILEAKYDLQIK